MLFRRTVRLMPLTLSVIVPTYNEENVLAASLDRLASEDSVEIILVDAGSNDQTRSIAEKYSLILVQAKRGRASQMNAGAVLARGEILCFVHADTLLPFGYKNLIREALQSPEVIAGAFSLHIGLAGRSIRLVEALANRRAVRRQLPYGDQGLFLHASRFHRLGGFPDLPLLEDLAFVEQLKKEGKIVILPKPATSSGRRWEKNGVLRTSLLNQLILTGYRLGISPARLARIYLWPGR
jgi:rSAM/selenodomain-associated transferase 2